MLNFGTSVFVIIARIDFFHCCIHDHNSENQTYHVLHSPIVARIFYLIVTKLRARPTRIYEMVE